MIVRPFWNSVVLQEATYQAIPPFLSGNRKSKPGAFCKAVNTIEQAIHRASPATKVFLYETGAPSDTAYRNSTSTGFSDMAYRKALSELTDAYHDAYLTAAAEDQHIAGTAATGDAWSRAWAVGVANPDPYGGTATGVPLTFNYQQGSDPQTSAKATGAGFHHPSIYGAYLNSLVLFQTLTGTDVRTFGETEKAAHALHISLVVATQLQQIAWESVTQQSTKLIHKGVNACIPSR